MAVIQSAERLLPAGLRGKAEPFLRALASDDPRSRAQRMALVTFAIRVVSAAIAFLSQIVLASVRSPQDVLAELEAGNLKGRKIGSAWRIAQAALDEFLAG